MPFRLHIIYDNWREETLKKYESSNKDERADTAKTL
jgi:hypothetical protein